MNSYATKIVRILKPLKLNLIIQTSVIYACILLPQVDCNNTFQGRSREFKKGGAKLRSKCTEVLDQKPHPLIKSRDLEYSIFVPFELIKCLIPETRHCSIEA